jgi:AcrR family transcriptional regulator
MSPRPYRLERRRVAADQTRARIIAAARDVLLAGRGFPGFTIDAIARHAGVARMTVYYQFRSKAGLLEAIFDDLAARGEIRRLAEAFAQPDPQVALRSFVAAFGHFYAADRLMFRRLHAYAALDPEIEHGLTGRAAWRRDGLGVLVGRMAARFGAPAPRQTDEAIDLLHMLTSFESFDALAGQARSPEDVAPAIAGLALSAIERLFARPSPSTR